MTLGEHIQSLRKEKGLSQEALGEALGVTRQSISKWESDGAIPEIDKLIALSKLFGVTVGELLQVEDPAETEVPLPHELTERELEAVEAIVSKYLQASAPKRKKRWWKPALLLCAALAVWFGISSWTERIQQEIDNLYRNSGSMEDRLVRQINSVSKQVEEILERQNRVTADHSYEVEGMDMAAGTVTFSLSAVPRQYQEGMTAQFTAQADSGAVTTAEGSLDPVTLTFSTLLTAPLEDGISLSVTFTAPSGSQNQVLGWYDSLFSDTLIQPQAVIPFLLYTPPSETWEPYLHIYLRNGEYVQPGGNWTDVTLNTLRLRLWESGEDTPLDFGLLTPDSSGDIHWSLPDSPLSFSHMEEGDWLAFSALCTDSLGRSYEVLLDGYQVQEGLLHSYDVPAFPSLNMDPDPAGRPWPEA